MARHVEPSPGYVNDYIAFAWVGDAARCHEAHEPLAWACSVLVDDGDIKGSNVTRIERLPGGEIDWFSTRYGEREGVARDELVEAHRPLVGEHSPHLVVHLSYDVDADGIDAKLESFAETHHLTLVRRHGPSGRIERFAR